MPDHNYRLVIVEKKADGTAADMHTTEFTADPGYGETLYDICVRSVVAALRSMEVVPASAAPRTRRQTLKLSGLRAPEPGTEFELLGPDGRPHALWSRVKRVESEDLDEGIYEILDRYNRTYQIRHNGQSWEQVEER